MAQEIYREPFERRSKGVGYLTFLRGFADTQIGPVYLGMWGLFVENWTAAMMPAPIAR